MGIAMCFLWGNILKTDGSGQSNVGSGTSMTLCCVVSANILYTLIQQALFTMAAIFARA